MTFDAKIVAARMRANTHVVAALCADVGEEQARWRPADNAWSMIEVICHLGDEEGEDFRARLDSTLHAPDVEWPTIRPGDWVTERAYAVRSLPQELNRWLAERESSLGWMLGLQDPNWNAARVAPWGAMMRAGDIAAAWAAHDLLHIRQLTELQHAWHMRQSAPYTCGYAGEW